MTTKSLIIIVAAAVTGVVLVIVLAIAVVMAVAFFAIGNSEAAQTAKSFLRESERLQEDVGEIKDFGRIITGNVSVKNSEGEARLGLKVIGSRETVRAEVELQYTGNEPWKIIRASYVDKGGRTIDLLE